jgi:hypothetical protein
MRFQPLVFFKGAGQASLFELLGMTDLPGFVIARRCEAFFAVAISY